MATRPTSYLSVIFFFLLCNVVAKANDEYFGDFKRFKETSPKHLQQAMRHYIEEQRYSTPTTVFDALRSNWSGNNESQQCIDFYSKLYEGKAVQIGDKKLRIVDARIFFGYNDFTVDNKRKIETVDLHIKYALLQFLLKPCDQNLPNLHACGFRSLNHNIIYKNIRNARGETVTFMLTAVHSSLWKATSKKVDPANFPSTGISNPGTAYKIISRDGRVQQTVISDEQAQYSQGVHNLFFQSLEDADIVFYNGHSRRGGGPDFFPPVVFSDYHTAYETWYERLPETNTQKMDRALRRAYNQGRAPKLIGMYSCQSQQHFHEGRYDFTKSSPETAFLFNAGTTGHNGRFALYDVPAILIASINAMLGQYCPQSFNSALYNKSIDPRSAMRFFPPKQR